VAKANDSVRGLPRIQVQAKVRLSKIEQIHGQFERRFCQGRLIESGKRLATRMRSKHVAVIAIRSHLAAARGFIVGGRTRQHTREERSYRQKHDDEANPEFGKALQLDRAYPQLALTRKLRRHDAELRTYVGASFRVWHAGAVEH